MSINKLLSGSVLFVSCVFPVLVHAASAPMCRSVRQIHEQSWGEKEREKKARERDQEIRWREQFQFDHKEIEKFVTESASFVIPAQCVETVRSTIAQDHMPPKEQYTISIYELLQRGKWDRHDGISSLRAMKLNMFADLCRRKKDEGIKLVRLMDEDLLTQAQRLVIEEVMKTVRATSEDDFLQFNRDRLKELRAQKEEERTRQALRQEEILRHEQEEAERIGSEMLPSDIELQQGGMVHREKGQGGAGDFTGMTLQKKAKDSPQVRIDWKRYVFSNGMSTLFTTPLVFMPRVPYIKKKLDSLRLSKLHSDRFFRAILGAYVTQLFILFYDLSMVSGSGLSSPQPGYTLTFCGARAMLNYMVLDLVYNYGSDFLGNRMHKNRVMSRWISSLRDYESRLRRRFKYYDFLKNTLDCTGEMMVASYGAHQYIDRG